MNVKLHTPKSLKMGSGMGSMKQFLLSLLATTVSIALTFGTAAIIDYKKKQREKREIVMMVMYDMYNSLVAIENADSMIRQSMQAQLQIAEDTTKFNELMFTIARDGMAPLMAVTEETTTERIFSSSIETINTVGNVLFTENVEEFYHNRRFYKSAVCDSLTNSVKENPLTTLNGVLYFDQSDYAMLSGAILKDMRRNFARCKQIMKVTDKEIDVYRVIREKMDKNTSITDSVSASTPEDVIRLQMKINDAKEKLRLN